MNQRIESARLELAQSTGAQPGSNAVRSWTTKRDEKRRRLAAIAPWLEDGILPAHRIIDALETLIRPGDRVALEGDNQKQADFLSRSFAKVDPQKVHDVHLL
ncbi:malonate decarboxylase subunit alpha, partial [Rhizobium phaseoli]